MQPRFEIVYPRPGLPGLLRAGDDLVARVRLPSPLTPPPGVQQPRALAGFSAALTGRARAVGSGIAEGAHRYALEVIDVRPDAGSSLLYRATVRVPAFAAPGTYDFELAAPGGSGRVLGAVRVLAPGAAPRFASIARPSDLTSPEAAALPIDLWIAANGAEGAGAMDAPPASGAAPLFAPGTRALAIRTGQQLWQFGACGGPTDMFAAEVNTAASAERRVHAKPPSAALAPGQFQRFGSDAQAMPGAGALRFAFAGATAELSVSPGFPGHAELDLAIPAAHRARIGGADAAFHPGSDIAGGKVPVRIAHLRIAPGTQASVRIEVTPAGAPGYALIASPAAARSGERVRFALRPLAPAGRNAPPRIAFRFGPLHTAFGATAEHTFIALGAHRVQALAVEGDGRAYPLQVDVRVQTARAGCSAAGGAGVAAAASLWPAVLLIQRRRLSPKKPRSVRLGNRLRAGLGSRRA